MDILSSGERTIFCHQISCLLLINHTCKDDHDSDGPYANLTNLLKKCRRKIIFLLIDLMQTVHVEYRVLIQTLADIAGENAADLFNERMHGLVSNNYGNLFDFLETIEPLVSSGNDFIHRNSMFGIFLRKALLTLQKMTFSQISELGKELESYISSNKLSKFPDELVSDTNMELETEILEGPKDNMNTLSQAGKFITQQARLLESQSPYAQPPKQLQEKIEEIFEKFPNAVDAYYLSYLNYLRLGEARNALFNLHKYFDYQKWDADENANGSNNDDAEKNSTEKYQMKFKRFRYCALNLGIFHSSLGHQDVALAAVEEAVKMAQLTNDSDCLLHTMFWLHRLKSKSDPICSQSLLEKFTKNATELGYSQLQSLGVLTQCRLDAFSGLSDFENIQLRLNKIDSMTATKSDIPARQIQIGRSALLDFYGFRTISCYASQIALYETENADSSLRHSLHSFESQDPKSTILGLCQTAKFLGDEGLVNEALDILEFGTTLIPEHGSNQKWLMLCKWQLLFDRCILMHEIKSAKQAILEIRSLDEEDANLKECKILLLTGNTLEAASKVEYVLQQFAKNSEVTFGNTPSAIYHVRLLQLKAEIFASSKELPKAMECLLQCIDICRAYKMLSIEAEISLNLVQYKIRLGLAKQSKSIVEKHMIQILSHGTLYVRSLAFLELVKSSLWCNGKEGDRKAELLSLLPMLETALSGFRYMNAQAMHCEALYVMAWIYEKLGYTEQRNKYAKDLRQRLELRTCKPDKILGLLLRRQSSHVIVANVILCLKRNPIPMIIVLPATMAQSCGYRDVASIHREN
eukprot:gene16245-17884_t